MKHSTINRIIVGSSLLLALGLSSINYEQNRIIQNQRVVLRLLLNDSASLAQCKVAHERTAAAAAPPNHVVVKAGAPVLANAPSPTPRPTS